MQRPERNRSTVAPLPVASLEIVDELRCTHALHKSIRRTSAMPVLAITRLCSIKHVRVKPSRKKLFRYHLFVSRVTQITLEGLRVLVRQRVKTEGLRPFARAIGVAVGRVRSLEGDRPVKSTTSESVAKALGFEITVDAQIDTDPFATAPSWAIALRDELFELRADLGLAKPRRKQT